MTKITNPTINAPIFNIPLTQIRDNPYQTRLSIDADHILNLAISINDMRSDQPATKGLQQVPLGRICPARDDYGLPPHAYSDHEWLRQELAKPNTTIQLAFGHSRFRAFQVLAQGACALFPSLDLTDPRILPPMPEYETMPLMLVYADDLNMWRHAVTENHQRKGITAIEEARSLAVAEQTFGLTTEQAGHIFGWARSTAANKKRLLKLPDEVQTILLNGEISERHARCLLEIDDPVIQLQIATENKGETIQSWEWEVRRQKQIAENEKALQQQEEVARNAGFTVIGRSSKEKFTLFGEYGGAPLEFIKKGTCSAQSCACFAVCHIADYQRSSAHLSLPVQAPNMGAGCTNLDAMRPKIDAYYATARAADVAKKDKKATSIHETSAQALDLWKNQIEAIHIDNFWNSPAFWQLVVSNCFSYSFEFDKLKGHESMLSIKQALLTNLLNRSASYDVTTGSHYYKSTEVQALIEKLLATKK